MHEYHGAVWSQSPEQNGGWEESWDEQIIWFQYRYETNLYNIKVEHRENTEEKKVFCNGIEIKEKYIELRNDNKIENVEIKL